MCSKIIFQTRTHEHTHARMHPRTQRALYSHQTHTVTVLYRNNCNNIGQLLYIVMLLQLAATLRGSRPGVQSASPKTPKTTSFLGVTQPPGVAQPLYSRGHN